MFVKKRQPEWLPFVTIVTALYLIVEFGFNARLLDVIGATPTADQLHSIEQYGRYISGFAVALMVWGWLTARPRKHVGHR